MNYKLDILVCPACRGELEAYSRVYICRECHLSYPIVKGIPRFVKTDNYVDSFSWEWDKHSETLVDSLAGGTLAHDMFAERTGLTQQDIKGKLCLDAGCGSGRFLEVIREFGGQGVGIDMSYAVDHAHRILGDSVPLVQGDLLNMPFKDGSFDVVFSIGVIHHTSDAHKAFKNLARLVKPNGILAVWVYSNEGLPMKAYNAVSATYRIATTRLPRNVLYKLCYLSVPAYWIYKVKGIGRLSCLVYPRSTNAIAERRVLDTFDWYSPKYQSKHTYKELESWCAELKMADVKRLSVPVSIRCVKP